MLEEWNNGTSTIRLFDYLEAPYGGSEPTERLHGDEMQYFCPNCFAEIEENARTCPHCQFHLDQWDNLDYDHKLIAAIHHKETFTRMRAVYLLGERKTLAAIEPLKAAFLASDDPYFKAEILTALMKIEPHQFRQLVENIDLEHESAIVQEQFKQIMTNK